MDAFNLFFFFIFQEKSGKLVLPEKKSKKKRERERRGVGLYVDRIMSRDGLESSGRKPRRGFRNRSPENRKGVVLRDAVQASNNNTR